MNTLQSLYGNARLDKGTHDNLVRRVAVDLRLRGYHNVQADLPDYQSPTRIYWESTGEGHIPDVTGGPYIVEVETGTSLGSEHTKSQCTLFSAFARPRGLFFVVVVPIGYKMQMLWQLRAWQIGGNVWEF